MAIDAIALLRVPPAAIPADRVIRVLDDGVLVRTGARFDEEPEALADILCDALGDALDDHEDPRGVLLIPSVADPKATTYDAVVEEIGEGGTWAPISGDPGVALGGLFSRALEAMQAPGMQSALAQIQGQDPDALRAQMEAMLADPDLRKMAFDISAQLAADPAQLAALQQLVGGGDHDEDDDDPQGIDVERIKR